MHGRLNDDPDDLEYMPFSMNFMYVVVRCWEVVNLC